MNGSDERRSASALFRPEVLERQAFESDGGPGVENRLTIWAFRALVVGVAIAAQAAWSLRVAESAQGDAVLFPGAGQVLIILPAGAGPRLRPGLPVRLRLGEPTPVSRTTQLASIEPPMARSEAWHRYRVPTGADVVVIARAPVATSTAPGHGRAAVVLGHRRLAEVLISGLGTGGNRG